MRTRGDERIRLSGLVFIVAVLVGRLSYDATGGAVALRAYAAVNLAIALVCAGIVALAMTSLQRTGKPAGRRRLHTLAAHFPVRTIRKPRSRGSRSIHLN
jgi:hypothetical protein